MVDGGHPRFDQKYQSSQQLTPYQPDRHKQAKPTSQRKFDET
jgi:hypothetical protein